MSVHSKVVLESVFGTVAVGGWWCQLHIPVNVGTDSNEGISVHVG